MEGIENSKRGRNMKLVTDKINLLNNVWSMDPSTSELAQNQEPIGGCTWKTLSPGGNAGGMLHHLSALNMQRKTARRRCRIWKKSQVLELASGNDQEKRKTRTLIMNNEEGQGFTGFLTVVFIREITRKAGSPCHLGERTQSDDDSCPAVDSLIPLSLRDLQTPECPAILKECAQKSTCLLQDCRMRVFPGGIFWSCMGAA